MGGLRALGVWLAAAVIGSATGTVLFEICLRDDHMVELVRDTVAVAAFTLFWTVPGSGLLFLIFGGLSRLRLALRWRVVATVCAGAVTGGLVLGGMFPKGWPDSAAAGALFGLTTALAWAGLSWLAGGFRAAAPTVEA